MKNLILLLLSVLIVFVNIISSQDKNLPLDISEAINLIEGKEFSSALIQLQTIRNKYPERQSLIDFLIIKCSDELARFENVEKISKEFLDTYSESKYSDDVQLFLIKSLIQQSKYEEGFKQAIEFMKKTKSVSKKIELKSFIENATENKLTSTFLQQIADKENDKSVQPFILLLTAKSFYNEGNPSSGQKYADRIITNHIASEEYLPAVNLKHQTSKDTFLEKLAIVGVMLPLTNEQNEKNNLVEQILIGIKYAFHEYNKNREDKIGLIIEDTKNNPEEILRIIKEFDADKRIKCVIGPIFSSECAEIVKNIHLTDLVFISPTATSEDLTERNDQLFQANPPFDLRGKAFAQYAFFVESKSKFAVINSIEGYSAIMANSFIEEMKKLGGQIIFKDTYRDVTTDLLTSIPKLKNYIKEIDGIYLPISQSKDAELLLLELQKHNIKVPVFGTEDWLEAKGLEASTAISNLIRVTADYFIDYKDPRFIEFSNSFSEVIGKEPNRYNLYGYDVAKHLLTILKSPIQNRYGIKQKLASGLKTVGFKNNISFSHKRRNTYLNILRYNNGKFSLVERFKANE